MKIPEFNAVICMAKKPMTRLMPPDNAEDGSITNAFAGTNDEQRLVLGGIEDRIV
jgi:hypothetical protein